MVEDGVAKNSDLQLVNIKMNQYIQFQLYIIKAKEVGQTVDTSYTGIVMEDYMLQEEHQINGQFQDMMLELLQM